MFPVEEKIGVGCKDPNGGMAVVWPECGQRVRHD